MADDDLHELAEKLRRKAEELMPLGVVVPDDDVSEDEAVQSVQQQFKDAGFECSDDEARRVVREAWHQQ